MHRVAIIGGGITGLCAAAHAARLGHDVQLFEANAALGGVAGTLAWHGHTYAPGPQYMWGWEPGGPAQQALQGLDHSPRVRLLPDDFEQAAFNDSPFATVHAHTPPQLASLSPRQRASAHHLSRALDRAGEAGAVLGPQALFRLSGLKMMRAILCNRDLNLSSRMLGLRLRNTSVQAYAHAHDVDPHTLRMLTHSQGIFAEELDSLSALLFASARRHLKEPLYFPEGGFAQLIAALISAAQRAGAKLHTNQRITQVRSYSPRSGTTLGFERGHHARFDHVIWACSPGQLAAQLKAQPQAQLKRIGARLDQRFEPSNPISAINVLVQLTQDQRRRLTDKNFSWFADDQPLGFDSQGPASPRTLNFSSPTLQAGSQREEQVICAFSNAGCSSDALLATLTTLLERLHIHAPTLDVLAISPQDWTDRFGAYRGSVYGRRLTTRSLRTSLCALMPPRWQLAHSGAAIPGVLGCLQLGRAAALNLPTTAP